MRKSEALVKPYFNDLITMRVFYEYEVVENHKIHVCMLIVYNIIVPHYISYLKALQLLNKHSYSCFSWNAFPPHYLFQSYKMVVYCFTLCNILAYVVSNDVIKHIFQNTLDIKSNLGVTIIFYMALVDNLRRMLSMI